VERVSYEEAKDFCKQLSALDKAQGYDREYKLPTEAQWEYACREAGKTTTVFHYGNNLGSDLANFDGNSPYGGAKIGRYLARTAAVDSKEYKPNELGLYHMHGNVRQWCLDWYDDDYYSNSRLKDPEGPENGRIRVVRGGSWVSSGWGCRAARRSGSGPGGHGDDVGFRIVVVLPSRTR
jgi:formylglycine-generating enzyme required for sulfatase activity